ncbi:SUMO1 sentrin specific peptidase 1 [Homalodisca vitripennis]|nr:SUMO1 sentrin specific peptidase 1 [Homalodisca vitripennis]
MARVVRKQVRLLPCDSERLFPGQLLNGEVILAYLRLLERQNAMDHNLPNVLALDSYFFTVLKRSGHERARGHHRDQDLWGGIMRKSSAPYMRKPRKETISAYDSLKGRNHKPAMDLLREYLKKEEMRAKTEPRSWCLYGERSCPSQDNLVDCGVFLCAITGAICGGREAKELRVDGREFRRQMAKELREDSVTENKSSQPELFPGEEPDWSFEDLAKELDQLTDPTKWSLILPAEDETPEEIGVLQEEVDAINPSEGAAGTSSGHMEIDKCMSPKPTLLELARLMGSSIEVIPDPEEEDFLRVAPSVKSQPEETATQERMGDPPERPDTGDERVEEDKYPEIGPPSLPKEKIMEREGSLRRIFILFSPTGRRGI